MRQMSCATIATLFWRLCRRTALPWRMLAMTCSSALDFRSCSAMATVAIRRDHEANGEREMLAAAVAADGTVLQFAPEDLRDDFELVRTAVKQNGWALVYASDELRNDRDIVLAAVSQNGFALAHAGDDLLKCLRFSFLFSNGDRSYPS
mmetsp:Transcript_53964/g.99706  ORF Transcript_53964/g.99706 Transcript_53964/m.99706 type:complete len:149 (-) Transcript_53964:122-568(-)